MPKAREIFQFLGSGPGSSGSFADGSPPLQGYPEKVDSGIFSMSDKVDYKNYVYQKVRSRIYCTLVDSRSCTSKWQGDYCSKSGFTNFLRCFKDQMRNSSGRNQHRKSLERARSPRPNKLLGAGSSISGSQSFSASDKGESCAVGLGQLRCSSIHYLAGRYRISTPHSIGTRHTSLCSRLKHGDISNSCFRKWNHIAEGESRIFHDSIEWMIDHNLLNRILKLPGTGKIHPLCCQKKFQLAAWKQHSQAIW